MKNNAKSMKLRLLNLQNSANTCRMLGMNSRPTLKELSAMTGVSMATISRALSNPGKVRPATRMRIEAAIREFRQKSSSGRSGLIGMIVPDIANEFFPLMLSGVDSESSESGCTVMLCSCNGQQKAEERALRKLLDIGVDGIIYITSGSAPPLLKETIASGALPVIFLDRDPGIPGTALITTDNRNGMLQAAMYLTTLGHRRILSLGGSEGTSTHAGFSASAAYEAVKDLIASGGFGYTAIAAANDVMALGALKAIREAKKRVPEDVSIIGYDDIPSAAFSDLTTVRQPFMEMGRSAILQLMAAISDCSMPQKRTVLPSSIVFRGTCAIARS